MMSSPRSPQLEKAHGEAMKTQRNQELKKKKKKRSSNDDLLKKKKKRIRVLEWKDFKDPKGIKIRLAKYTYFSRLRK